MSKKNSLVVRDWPIVYIILWANKQKSVKYFYYFLPQSGMISIIGAALKREKRKKIRLVLFYWKFEEHVLSIWLFFSPDKRG